MRLASQNGDEATVIVTSRSTKDALPESTTLGLRLDHDNIPTFGKDTWRIVPPSIDEVLAKPFRETPLLLRAAVLATRNPRLEPIVRRQRAIAQVKELALGAFQSSIDFDNTFVFDDAGHERALQPYLKNDPVYTITGTKDEKWHFNAHLAELSQAKLADTSHTVMFYDGTAPQSDALNFRFDGKTVIGFADGHAAALSKDEVKDLIWAP